MTAFIFYIFFTLKLDKSFVTQRSVCIVNNIILIFGILVNDIMLYTCGYRDFAIGIHDINKRLKNEVKPYDDAA